MSLVLQELNPGTTPGDSNAETVYTTFTKTKSNFEAVEEAINSMGDNRAYRFDIDLNGVAGDTEAEQVANAINAMGFGHTVPLGYRPIVRYLKPFDTSARTAIPTETQFYEVYYYTLVPGHGYYGQGTPPAGVSAINVTAGKVIPMGKWTQAANSLITTLGEIGATPIATAVTSSGTELVVDGLTVFQVLRSGTLYEYQFNGIEQSYGASWNSAAADNFIDLSDNGDLAIPVTDAKYPKTETGDINIGVENMFKTNVMTANDTTITIQDEATAYLDSGSWARFSFSGTGTHTINYPTTDGESQIFAGQGALIYVEKRGADEWIVKVLGSELPVYTVATLPASPPIGFRAYVSDASTPLFMIAVTGGGSNLTPVFYNGTDWLQA